MTDRREFLKKLAKGAVYSAPIIYTMSTPRELRAIVTSGMIMVFNSARASDQAPQVKAPWEGSSQPASPWEEPAPWSAPPPSTPPSGGDGRE